MKKRLFFAAFLAMSGLVVPAQINSPAPRGYESRALLMLDDYNYPGAADQTARAIELGAASDSRLIEALTAVKTSDPRARRLLEDYQRENPASPYRCLAQMALGDLDFAAKQWGAALTAYSVLDPRSLDADMAEDLHYRLGYCRLMLGDYAHATLQFDALAGTKRYGQAALFYQGYIAYVKGDYTKALELMDKVDTTAEPGASAPYYIMEMQFARGEWLSAASVAKTMLERKDAPAEFTVEALRIAGESEFNLGNEDVAAGYLWKYVAMKPDGAPTAYYALGMTEYRAGNTDAAIKLLQRAITAEYGCGQSAYLTLGQAYMRRGDTDAAIMAFDRARSMNFDRSVTETAFYNYAVAKMDGGRVPFGSSVNMLEEFLEEFPQSPYAPDVQRYIINGYMTDNDYDAALAAIERVQNPGREILMARQRVLLVVASREVQSGRVAEAEQHLRKLQEMGKGYNDDILAQSNLWMGECLYTVGDYAGAARSFNAYLKQAGAADSNRLTALYDLGYAEFAAGNYSAALTAFEKAGKAVGGDESLRLVADLLNRQGDCRYYASDFSAAAKLYQRAFDTLPESGDYALYQLAVVKGLRGDHKGKIADIDRLIADFPSTAMVPQALLEKAESQVALGDNKGAVQTYNTLVARHSTTSAGRNGYLQLALIYLNSGDKTKAIDTYKAVIKSYPASDEARLAADDLKHLLAAEGRLADYVEFVKSVPGSPTLDAVEMDNLTFEAAEHAYLTDGELRRVTAYLTQFPTGAHRAKALYYQAEHSWNSGDASGAEKLAGKVVADYPHTEAAEMALRVKGEAEQAQGKWQPALATFRSLEECASSAALLHQGRLGAMRSASMLGRDNEVVEAAGTMLASSASSVEQINEVRYLRALSLDRLKRYSEADKEWKSLASKPADLYGSMSAVAYAQSLLDRGRLKEAAKVADDFINANPPHQYWLARGFIVYSDILRKRDDVFEADEYLKSLRANYPGKEADIRQMITDRLK